MSGEAKDLSEHTPDLAFTNVVRSITINVYLPKNLINYGILINLLGEVLEFNRAQQDLVQNVEMLLPMATKQFPEVLTAEHFLLTADLKAPKPEPVEVLRSRLRRMKRRIKGYSIFEADGAFEHDDRGNTIPVHTEETFKYPREALAHFENCEGIKWLENAAAVSPEMIEWLENAAAVNPEKRGVVRILQRSSSVSLTEDSSRNLNQTRRILSYEVEDDNDQRHHFIISQDDTVISEEGTVDVRMRKCIRLLEERTLVIKFIIPVDGDEGWSPQQTRSKEAKDALDLALWDALMLIGCFFARRLGDGGEGLEDEIWISYDFGHLWTWQGGKPKPPHKSRRNALSDDSLPQHS
jgi:hypothetical protein